ncbi:MAG: ATP synthase F1 subunit epsilon [Spirochaetales bacterium]|nr:ATP synthase F1 subunit epsilon [Spirochaetales bacterium]
MKDRFHLSVVSPDASLFEGEVRWARIPTSAGLIGILPGHAPLLGLLGPGLLTLETTAGQEPRFLIRDGFLEVLRDRVTVLAGHAELATPGAGSDAQALLDAARTREARGDHAINRRLEEQAFQRARLKHLHS